jgi:hypothetical protein
MPPCTFLKGKEALGEVTSLVERIYGYSLGINSSYFSRDIRILESY